MLQQAVVVLLRPDRDADAAAHGTHREALLQQPVVLGLRVVDRDIEEVRVRFAWLEAEPAQAFGLAGARVGYALAGREVAAELNKRQHPAPLSTLSAALALAGLAAPPDVGPILEERERMAERLRELGFEPRESHANFLYVPVEDGLALMADRFLAAGFSEDDVHTMAVANTRRVAGLAPVTAAVGG